MAIKWKKFLVPLFLLIGLTGCSQVTQENYDNIKMGMNFEEITDVLGDADRCDEKLGTRNCVWGDEKVFIKVSFVGDNAILFSNDGLL